MIKSYAVKGDLIPASDKKLNYFCWNYNNLALIPNDGRGAANVKTFGYCGRDFTQFKKDFMLKQLNEQKIFNNKIDTIYFERLNNITYYFYNIYNQVKSPAYKINIDYDNSILTVNGKSIKVRTAKNYTIKFNKNSISSNDGIFSLATFLMDACSCESPVNAIMQSKLDRILEMKGI